MGMRFIGILGLVLIAGSWIPQIVKIIRSKKSGLSINFALIYVIGSLALVIHAIQIKDGVFIILNSLTSFMGFLGLFYTIKYGKRRK